MREALRPMSLGEIVDRTFQIYRSRFVVFATLGSLPALAMMALESANQFWWKLLPENTGPRIFLGYTPQNLAYFVVLRNPEILFNLIVWPVFSLLVSKSMFAERLSAMSAFAAERSRWRSWIGITFANWCLPLIVPELLIFAVVASAAYLLFEILKLDGSDSSISGPMTLVAAVLVGWIVFQWVSAGLCFSLPIWILEKSKICNAIRRSWWLSRGSRVRIAFVRVMPPIIGSVVNFLFGFLIGVFLYLFLRHTHYWWSLRRNLATISILTRALVSAFIGPIFPIALTLIYYDQRIRLEGYDIEWMMDAAGMNSPAGEMVHAAVPASVSLEESQG